MTVTPPDFGKIGKRRLHDDLLRRAHAWLPDWHGDSDGKDALGAILDIAATISADVTQRLDRVPEKSFRGMLHWLGRRGRSGSAARMPVVFRMSPRAESLVALAPIQLQADADGTPVIFETDAPVPMLPTTLSAVFAADPAQDEYYGPYPGLDSLTAPEPAPDEWRVLATPTPGASQVQLDPPEGLHEGLLLSDETGWKYRVEKVQGNLVTLSPGLGVENDEGTVTHLVKALWRVEAFTPFDEGERNKQRHHLYLGGDNLLDVKAAAIFELMGDAPESDQWEYSVKPDGPDGADWAPLVKAVIGGRLFLIKPAGEIEKREIHGSTLRWLRTTSGDGQQFARDIHFSVNCLSGLSAEELKELGNSANQAREIIEGNTIGAVKLTDMEAVANTAPIVLDANFHPLGREPRLFDAFYLSCPEAFAKPNAYARVTFTIGESFAGPLSVASYDGGRVAVIAGVTVDGRLRLARFERDDKDTESNLTFFGPFDTPKTGGRSRPLLAAQKVGIATSRDGIIYVSAADGQESWVWACFDGGNGVLGVEPWFAVSTQQIGAAVATMLARSGDGDVDLYVVADGKLARRKVYDSTWVPIEGPQESDSVLIGLMPFETNAAAGAQAEADGLVAVSATGQVFWTEQPVVSPAIEDSWNPVTLPKDTVAANAWPLAVLSGKQRTFFLCVKDGDRTLVTSTSAGIPPGSADKLPRYSHEAVGGSFAFLRLNESRLGKGGPQSPSVVFAVASGAGRQSLVFWNLEVDENPLEGDAYTVQVEQAPVGLFDRLLVPSENASITEQALPGLLKPIMLKHYSIAMTTAAPIEDGKDIVLRSRNGKRYPVEKVIEDVGYVFSQQILPDEMTAVVYRFEGPFEGRSDGKTFVLDKSDATTASGSLIRVKITGGTIFVRVKSVRLGVATLDEEIRTGDGQYFSAPKSSEIRFQLFPLVSADDSPEVDLARSDVRLWFGEGEPANQSILQMIKTDDGQPQEAILGAVWEATPDVEVPATLITLQGARKTYRSPTVRDPELSWEYWNGRGWWRLKLVREETNSFRNSGVVSFCVPSDLTESEVVGRKGHWIRARLIAGDYGQETFTLIPAAEANRSATGNNRLEHDGNVIERDRSTIRAPIIAALSVTYELCCDSRPDRVITYDNGGFIDQTTANSAPNAQVPVFTPLVNALAQEAATGPTQPGQAPCCSDCAGVGHAAATASQPAVNANQSDAGARSAAAQPDPEQERAIYLGFSAPLKQAFNILFVVGETPYDGVRPLRVDALIGRQYTGLDIKDGTRGLSETGIVSLTCNEDIQPVTLFGQALHWLRLRAPDDVASGDWKPRIEGVFINATWARAWASRTNEIIGFSDGSQGQTFQLAHAPVLDGSLELLVREPIGEEETEILNRENAGTVRDRVDLWEGPWVRWQNRDVSVAGPDDRVFDLDASEGVISFGNGRQGRVPPIGSDNILAVSYRTVEAGAAANAIGPWDGLNMITPLRGVEAAITPEGAAGGSGTQDVDTTMRFASANIAMRDRAVTLLDFERHALQSSPDIVQTKAFLVRRGVEVVVILSGENPLPSSTMRRELAGQLRGISAPALQRRGGITVLGPRTAPVDIDVELTVTDLAKAGGIIDAVKRAVKALLDPATGGQDGRGWPLGAMPTADDLAAVIADVPDVEEIDDVVIHLGDAESQPFGPRHLAMLPPNAVAVICRQAVTEIA